MTLADRSLSVHQMPQTRNQERIGTMSYHQAPGLLRVATFFMVGLFVAGHVDATTLAATLRYRDTASAACPDPAKTGCVPLQPIAYGKVEIWHRGVLPWNFWVSVGQATTDGAGSFSFSDNRGDGTYGVRVYASNYAAVKVTSRTVCVPIRCQSQIE
jgi:hypothetical protein